MHPLCLTLALASTSSTWLGSYAHVEKGVGQNPSGMATRPHNRWCGMPCQPHTAIGTPTIILYMHPRALPSPEHGLGAQAPAVPCTQRGAQAPDSTSQVGSSSRRAHRPACHSPADTCITTCSTALQRKQERCNQHTTHGDACTSAGARRCNKRVASAGRGCAAGPTHTTASDGRVLTASCRE